MKIVADDFEGGSTLQHGGRKFNTEEKNKYMESYYGIIDARKAGDKEKEKEYADKLLESLHNYVKDEIADLADKEKETARLIEEGSVENESQAENMLYTPDDIVSMNKDLEDIFNSSIKSEETNYIQKVNLVSIQCSLLFTKYAKNKTHPSFSDNVGVFASIPEAIKNGSYKNYSNLKTNIKKNMGNISNFSLHALEHIEGYKHIKGYNNQPFDTYYLVNILPYISITEMMDAWFTKGIWMIGFSTRYQFTDGSTSWFSPIAFLFHDTLHAVGAFDCYGSGIGIGSKPKKINDKKGRIAANHNFIKNFYEYVKDKYKDKKDVSLLYSIKFIIFIAIHEQDRDCNKYFSNVSDKLTVFKESLWKLYEQNYSRRIKDKNDLYLLLPARIRNEENSEEVVTSYIQECIHNYSVALNDYQKEKNMKFLSGGKKTKKRKLKTTKKTIKTRR